MNNEGKIFARNIKIHHVEEYIPLIYEKRKFNHEGK